MVGPIRIAILADGKQPKSELKSVEASAKSAFDALPKLASGAISKTSTEFNALPEALKQQLGRADDSVQALFDSLPKTASGAIRKTTVEFNALSPALKKELADMSAAVRQADAFGGLSADVKAAIASAETAARSGGKSIANAVESGLDLDTEMRAEGQDGGRALADGLADGVSGAKGKIAGAVAAIGVGSLFADALDIDAAGDRLAASLGATPAQAKQYAKLAGDLYAGAWGESIDEVNKAIASVKTSIAGVGDGNDLRGATIQALDFAAAFEVDVVRATQVAGIAIKAGLAKDATGAFDLMTAAAQKVGPAMTEDVLDAVDEYGQFFSALGYSGEEAFSTLAASADKGVYGIDKAGDAIKEFTIRATDDSKSTRTALEELGLDFVALPNQLLAGGEKAQEATQTIIKAILAVEDPTDRAAAALALFGTPLEDLGTKDIPDFLKALQSTEGGLGKVEGAAKRAGEVLNDNAATDLKALGREAKQAGTDLLISLAPALTDALDAAQPLIEVVGNLADGFAALDEDTQKVVLGVAAAALALGPLASVARSTSNGLALVGGGLDLIAGRSARVAPGVAGASTAMGAATTNASRLGTAARGAAGLGGLGALTAGASTSNDAVKTLANVGGGAMLGFSVGGPIGAAIGAGGGLLLTLAQNAGKAGGAFRESIPPAENFAATLDRITGAATAQTRAQALLSAQQSGVIGLTQRLGVNSRDLIGSILGQRGATARLTAAYRENSGALNGSEQVKLNEFLRINTRGFQLQSEAVRQNFRNTQTWAQALKGLPPDVKTAVKAIGSEATAAQMRDLKRTYDLTPKQVRTIINAIGTEQTVKKVKGVYRVIEDGKRVRADLDPFVDNFTSSLRDAEDVARRGRGQMNKELRLTGRVPADLDPFQRSMLRGLGNVSQGANRSITGTGRMLTAKTAGTKANLNPFVSMFGQGMNRARDTAARGSEAARKAAERGPATARADLSILNGSLSSGLDRARGIASTGGNSVGVALKQGIEGGFSGIQTALSATAAAAVNAAVFAAKRAAESRSPSRKMMRVGRDLGLGMNIGLDGERSGAESSGRDLARAALRGAEAGLNDQVVGKLRLGVDDTYARRQGADLARSLTMGRGATEVAASIGGSAGTQTVRVRFTAEQMDRLARGREIEADLDAWRAVGGTRSQR